GWFRFREKPLPGIAKRPGDLHPLGRRELNTASESARQPRFALAKGRRELELRSAPPDCPDKIWKLHCVSSDETCNVAAAKECLTRFGTVNRQSKESIQQS